jgi:hypothetical protein
MSFANIQQNSKSGLPDEKAFTPANGFNLPLQTRGARVRVHKKKKGIASNDAKKPLKRTYQTIQNRSFKLYENYNTNPRNKARKFGGCRN